MKYYLFPIFILIFSFSSYSQDNYKVYLKPKLISFENQEFYISKVIDKRTNNKNIGFTRVGIKNTETPVIFDKKLAETLTSFYTKALSSQIDLKPIQIHVKKMLVTEEEADYDESITVLLQFDYFLGEDKIYSNEIVVEDGGVNATNLIAENVTNALIEAIIDFDQVYWKDMPAVIKEDVGISDVEYQPKKEEAEQKISELYNDTPKPVIGENTLVVGFFIGGFLNLQGVDLERRITNVVGIHAGVGIFGYTAGCKFHFKPVINGSHLNLSYKVGSFNYVSAFALEYGNVIKFNKKKSDIGIFYQVGLGKLNKVHPDYAREIFDNNVPEFVLSLGIGVAF